MKLTFDYVIAAGLALVFVMPGSAALIIKERHVTEAEDGTNTQVVETIYDAKNARINFLDGKYPMMGQGGYMLVHEDAMVIVNPAQRSYTRMGFGEIQAIGEQAKEMEKRRRESSDRQGVDASSKKTLKQFEFKSLLDEAGPTLVGYPTRHFKFRLKYKISESMPGGQGMTMDRTVEREEEFWAAAIPELQAPEGVDHAKGGLSGRAGDDEEIGEIADAQRTMASKGMRLKSIVVSKDSTGLGGAMGLAARMTMSKTSETIKSREMSEVLEIRREDVAASFFEIPAGYSEVNMMGPAAGMPDLNRIQGGSKAGDMPDLNKVPEN